MKQYKCKYCKDTGFIQIAPNVRGIKKCPYCKQISFGGYQPFITQKPGNPPKGSNAKDA